MTENKNDKRNQQSDNKSHQEQTQDGKKMEETNPENIKTNQSKRQGKILKSNKQYEKDQLY